MDAAITPIALKQRRAVFPPPTLVDVRRQPAFEADRAIIPGAPGRLPDAVQWGILIYDPLYTWCREAQADTPGWYPGKLRNMEMA